MQLYARYDEKTPDKKQKLEDHLNQVSKLSITLGFKELKSVQQLLGLLHDFGKASEDWQNYLFSNTDSRNEKVPHSPHGAFFLKELNEHYIADCSANQLLSKHANMLCTFMQFSIYAHHGIFDAIDFNNYENTIDKRNQAFMKKYGQIYTNAKNNFLKLYKLDYLQSLYKNAVSEFVTFLKKVNYIKNNGASNPKELNQKRNLTQLFFDFGFITKMLLSTLIDSDWTDSSSFFDIEKNPWKEIKDKFSFEICLEQLTDALSKFKEESEIAKVRKQIALECKQRAEELDESSGIFRLDLPTGAGKTLSVMRFSLIHAIRHKKDRIFYIAPFNSILEQNAMEYKKFLLSKEFRESQSDDNFCVGDFLILEHYGDVMTERVQKAEQNTISNYLIENWSSPIILTSMVQLLLTLFSSKSHSIRRLHSLYNSVIIIDEFQSVPIESTGLFNLAINALAHLFNATVILTTATQPPFWNRIESIKNGNKIPEVIFSKEPDIVKDYSNHPVFKRVDIIIDPVENEHGKPIALKNYHLRDLVQKVDESMQENNSMLVVLNTRDSVLQLYMELNGLQEGLPERNYLVFGLSNNMCKEHRSKVLQEVRENLKSQKLVLVSTPLIEAGVDISFEFGIRSLSALQTIIQTVGRINRNGELKNAKLLIVQVDSELEKTDRMRNVKLSKEILPALLYDFYDMPLKYDHRLDGKKMMNCFFEKFYSNLVEESHYPISLDDRQYKIMDMLSISKLHQKEEGINQRKVKELNQAFKTAGEQYKPIGEEQVDVLVQYQGGKTIMEELNALADHPYLSYGEVKQLLKRASGFSIGIRKYLVDQFLEEEKIFEIQVLDHKVYVLKSEYYGEIGLIKTNQASNDFIF